MTLWEGETPANRPGAPEQARSDETWVLGAILGVLGLAGAVVVIGTIANVFMMINDALKGAW